MPDCPKITRPGTVPLGFVPLLRLGAWGILLAAVLFRLVAILRFAVDVPLLDEWDMLPFLESNARDFQWRTLFEVHNDHRIAFTRLFIFLEYLRSGWNIRHALLVNYAVFVAMLAMLHALCRPALKRFPLHPLFFIPLFTDYVWINMAWSFQSQFHFMILFGLCAIWFGLVRPPTWGNTALFVLFCGFSLFSMSPAFAAGIWVVYLLAVAGGALRNNEPRPWAQGAVATVLLFGLVAAFFSGYSGIHLEGQPGFTLLYPWNGRFWSYVFKTLANAFGAGVFDRAPWMAFAVGPAMGLVLIHALIVRRPWDSGLLAPLAVVSASLVSLAAIAYGRGCMEPMACDRHMEVVLIAIPALLAIWAALPRRPVAMGGLLAAAVILVSGYAGYLMPREAPKMQRYLLEGQAEIIDYATGKKDRVDSGMLYPGDLTPRVLLARRLNLSFTRDIPEPAWRQIHSERAP